MQGVAPGFALTRLREVGKFISSLCLAQFPPLCKVGMVTMSSSVVEI